MSIVNVNSGMTESAIKKIAQNVKMIEDTVNKIEGNYKKASDTWKDAKYKELGKIVDLCTKELKKMKEEMEQICYKVIELHMSILEYEGTNIASSPRFNTVMGRVVSIGSQVGLAGLIMYQLGSNLFGDSSASREPTSGDTISRGLQTGEILAQRVDDYFTNRS